MLSQSPSAIKMRRFRAANPRTAPYKTRGRRPDFAKHTALVEAVEKVRASRFGNIAVLACDLGYANAESLRKAYEFARRALASSPVSREAGSEVAEASRSTPSSADRGWAR